MYRGGGSTGLGIIPKKKGFFFTASLNISTKAYTNLQIHTNIWYLLLATFLKSWLLKGSESENEQNKKSFKEGRLQNVYMYLRQSLLQKTSTLQDVRSEKLLPGCQYCEYLESLVWINPIEIRITKPTTITKTKPITNDNELSFVIDLARDPTRSSQNHAFLYWASPNNLSSVDSVPSQNMGQLQYNTHP